MLSRSDSKGALCKFCQDNWFDFHVSCNRKKTRWYKISKYGEKYDTRFQFQKKHHPINISHLIVFLYFFCQDIVCNAGFIVDLSAPFSSSSSPLLRAGFTVSPHTTSCSADGGSSHRQHYHPGKHHMIVSLCCRALQSCRILLCRCLSVGVTEGLSFSRIEYTKQNTIR